MAAGDIKGEEAVCLYLTSGSAIAKGDLLNIDSDGFWDPTTTGDIGKFAVACEAATGAAEEIRCVIWGRVEVDCSGAVVEGALGKPGTLGTVAVQAYTEDSSGNSNCGTFMEAAADAGVATLWVGLVN